MLAKKKKNSPYDERRLQETRFVRCTQNEVISVLTEPRVHHACNFDILHNFCRVDIGHDPSYPFSSPFFPSPLPQNRVPLQPSNREENSIFEWKNYPPTIFRKCKRDHLIILSFRFIREKDFELPNIIGNLFKSILSYRRLINFSKFVWNTLWIREMLDF